MEMELTQWRMFFSVSLSPSNTWPRCPSQLAQTISIRRPSASGTRFTAFGISSSKLGQPQCDRNLCSDVYRGASHWRQTYNPFVIVSVYSPVNGRSVPLSRMTLASTGVSLLYGLLIRLVLLSLWALLA